MKRTFSVFLILTLLFSSFGICAAAEDAHGIQLSLVANPSTGYTWTAVSSDEAVVRIDDNGISETNETVVGAPGMMQLAVTGVSAGNAALTFSYTRPWETDSDPMVSFVLSVTVDEALNVAPDGDIALPEVVDSGFHWEYAQNTPDVLEITPTDNGYHLNALADGTDSVTFGYLSPNSARLLWAFVYAFQVQDGNIYMPAVFFYREEGLDPFASEIPFSTTDLDGNPYTDAVFSDHTLTILNFWEPWCGPCVAEMPALQRISEEYADRGVQILGIYSTPDSEEEVREILESTGVRYPILNFTTDFNFLQTGYVPTTVIVDGAGRIIKSPFSGAMSYGAWVELIEGLL